MARHAGWLNGSKRAHSLTRFHSNTVPALSTCSQWLRKHLLPLTSRNICREICLTNQRHITHACVCPSCWWRVIMLFAKWVKIIWFCLFLSFRFSRWVWHMSFCHLVFIHLSFSIYKAGVLFTLKGTGRSNVFVDQCHTCQSYHRYPTTIQSHLNTPGFYLYSNNFCWRLQ